MIFFSVIISYIYFLQCIFNSSSLLGNPFYSNRHKRCHNWILLLFTQEIAELCESEQNIEKALVYYEKSADFYESEEVTTSANQCKQKVAQFSAQLEQYDFLGTLSYHSLYGRFHVNNCFVYFCYSLDIRNRLKFMKGSLASLSTITC